MSFRPFNSVKTLKTIGVINNLQNYGYPAENDETVLAGLLTLVLQCCITT